MEIPRGGVGFNKYMYSWNGNSRGGGMAKSKNAPCGGMDIFWNYRLFDFHFSLVCLRGLKSKFSI